MPLQKYNIDKLNIFNKDADTVSQTIIDQYARFLNAKRFPCIIARAALANQQVRCMTAMDMACHNDDLSILHFLYDFIDEYITSKAGYYSAVVIFKQPGKITEPLFEELIWKRLQALADLDAFSYPYDKRVNSDPMSKNFSFSIKGEAFYIIGLHRSSSRKARQFDYPAIVFNPHAQFEKLRQINKYQKIKEIIRNRDIAYCGTVNPMLEDFGKSSETFQYSGQRYSDQWKCPLNIKHVSDKDNTPT
jgi:FPC/CPF motif-containing protein YcgG